jgi:iron complex transport system ATP-binding protein
MTAALRWSEIGLSKEGTPILSGVSLTVAKGEVLGVVGPNGAGKSTLLRIAAGLEPAFTGLVEIDGMPSYKLAADERARRIAFLPQRGEAAWPIRVADAVALGRLPHGGASDSANDRRAVAEAMAATGIAALAARRLTSLSAGEMGLVLLARALAVEADLLLVDEPTAAFDPFHQLAVMELFQRLAAAGKSVCVVLHDLSLAVRFCHRLAVLAHGRLEHLGPPDDALDDHALRRVYAIEGVRHRVDGQRLLVPWKRLPRPEPPA